MVCPIAGAAGQRGTVRRLRCRAQVRAASAENMAVSATVRVLMATVTRIDNSVAGMDNTCCQD
jgi:hypothetical protein